MDMKGVSRRKRNLPTRAPRARVVRTSSKCNWLVLLTTAHGSTPATVGTVHSAPLALPLVKLKRGASHSGRARFSRAEQGECGVLALHAARGGPKATAVVVVAPHGAGTKSRAHTDT
jgi:hypothetical protein